MRTNKHKQSTRDRVVALHRSGIPVNKLAQMMRGLVDRSTIQLWVKDSNES